MHPVPQTDVFLCLFRILMDFAPKQESASAVWESPLCRERGRVKLPFQMPHWPGWPRAESRRVSEDESVLQGALSLGVTSAGQRAGSVWQVDLRLNHPGAPDASWGCRA